ncbi:MAG: hypothetical protein ACXWC9_05330 [Pseudobdellovibrionaceae bacterium]
MLSIRNIFLFCALFFPAFAGAKEIYEPYQSLRQLGMGGVYIFNENDAGSFMQNPAYSCYTSGLNLNVFDIRLGVGDIQSYMDLTNDGTSSLPAVEGMDGLGPYYGKDIWLGAGGFASLTLPCVGISGFYSGSTSFVLHNPAYPQLDAFYLTDYGVNIGGGFQISPLLSVGLAAKRVTRKGGPYVFGPDALANLSGSSAIADLVSSIDNEGVGYGLDVGVASRLQFMPFNPTISLAWKDVGSTAFVKTKGADAPERQKDNLVLGMTLDGSIPLLGFSAGFEYRHITDVGEQIGKKVHLGAELHLAMFDFRTGFYQGYTSYGLGVNLFILQLDIAKYTVERGVYPGQSPQERAHIGLMLDLELDPNFNLVDIGGRKRRLKQRR